MTAVDGLVVDIDYDVYMDGPEEDEYIVARALADFIPEEESRFIALETNAPVFIFTKHTSGWWTGECKGNNFVTEEFHVTLRPRTGEALEGDNRVTSTTAGTEYSSGDSDDTDSDDESDEYDEDDEGEAVNPNGSPPINIPNSTHATPEKHSLPRLTLPTFDSSTFLHDASKLTPVSRQLGEFVDRLNESTRTPPASNPTTPTHSLGTSPRFVTPPHPSAASRKSAVSALRGRTDSVGSDDFVYDSEANKLTPVSRQLGEFVERLNRSRTYQPF